MTTTPLTLVAADGFELSAVHYSGDVPSRGRVIVTSGTAVPQGFYRRFAEFMAGNGYETLTFDYRGIGGSAPESLRGFPMEFTDWARLDIAAAIDWAPRDELPLYIVGHSYGAVTFPLVPGAERVSALYGFGAGAGWHGWMPALERPRVLALWHLVGPALTRIYGYLPMSALGMGEDLPHGAYVGWKRWCARPHFLLDDPQLETARDEFAVVTTPMTFANSTDDRWAPPRSRDALLTGFTGTEPRRLDIDPATLGNAALGHMGYFREHARPLWDDVVRQFEAVRAG